MNTHTPLIAFGLGLVTLLAPACGESDGDPTPSPTEGVTAAALVGDWAVREVADDNYPSSEDGLLCDYAESGTLAIQSASSGTLTLRYTTECTDDSQSEILYTWDVDISETTELAVFELVLDGEDDNIDLTCDLDVDDLVLDCEDEDGDRWTFEQ